MKKKQPRYRWVLFGMSGSWSEYWLRTNSKKDALSEAVKHLKFGHNAILEDTKTNKVFEVKLKK
jgi:hypothetical protein